MVYFFCYMYLTNMWFSAVLFESAPKHLQVCMVLDGEFSSICAEAHGWANPSFFTFGKFVLQMTRYLLQLLRRVFAFHQCPFHTRASLGFCTFCFHNLHRKGPKKRWSFLRKCPTFFFFSPTFSEKCRTFLWASSHVFESGCGLQTNRVPWKSLFPFFCRKKASFQHSCVKVVKAKKCKPLEMRPRVTCAREKVIFLKVKSYPLQVCFTEGKNGYRFLFPLSNTLSHKIMTIVFCETIWSSLMSLWWLFFVWFCNVWVSYLMLLVVDTSLFRRFFTLYPHFHPYIYEGVKEESCTLRESAVEYLCEEHEWVPKIG